jgi:hypothetical protein
MAVTDSERRASCLRAAVTRAAVWTAVAAGSHLLIFDALAIFASEPTLARGPDPWPTFNLEFRSPSDEEPRSADEPVWVQADEFIDRSRIPSRRDPVEPLDPDYVNDVLDTSLDDFWHWHGGFYSG